jgi:tyrosinase
MIAKKYTSKSIKLSPAMLRCEFKHAILEFHQVDHSGASYQARIFFNNPKATEKTPLLAEQGYAGKFHIFGHGRCFGDKGHCHIPAQRRPFDTRSPHPLTPREVTVEVTDALKLAARASEELIITVVPIIYASYDRAKRQDCFHFDGMRIRLRSSYGLFAEQ